MHPKDIAVLGLAADVAGALLLARSFVVKGIANMYHESRTYAGGNRFAVKSALMQRAEAWGGGGLLLIGFVLQMLGALMSATPTARPFLHSWTHIVWLLLGSAGTFWIAQRVAWSVGRRQFLKYLFRGYEGKPVFPENPQPGDRPRLVSTGALYDMRMKRGETLAAFAARLNRFAMRIGVQYRGRLVIPGE